MYINDWKKGGGGVLAYIYLKLAPERLSLTWSFCTIEVLAIDITLGKHQPILGSIYRLLKASSPVGM